MFQSFSYLSDDNDQDHINSATHLCILTCLFILKGFINSFLTTMCDDKYGCEKKYCCTYTIYLISCIHLKYCITLDRYVGAPVSG